MNKIMRQVVLLILCFLFLDFSQLISILGYQKKKGL